MKRLLRASAASIATLCLSGCAGASLTQLWRDPAYASRPVKRVFVVAAMPGKANPAQFENAMAQALGAKGFEAATNLGVYPHGRVDRVKVKQYVDENKVDLLIMERLTTEAATPVVVSTTVAQSSGWYGTYGTAATSTTVVAQGTDVNARIDVYDVRTEPDTWIWSGQSNNIDIQDAARSLSAALVDELIRVRILAK